MKSLTPILIIVALGVAALAILAKAKRRGPTSSLYRPNTELFSAAERSFLVALDHAVGSDRRVFGKVRFADLVTLKLGLPPKVRQIALNRVAQKHVDFVICSSQTLSPVCVVELNDSSHDSNRAKNRDGLIANVCSQVGLPLVTVKAARSYSPDALRQEISTAITKAEGQGARHVA